MDPAVLQHVALLQNKKRKCEEAEEDIILLATSLSAVAAAQYFTMNFVKNPQHTSVLSGRAWMEELLTGHPKRMRDNMGISQAGFQYLEQLLIQNGGLKSARYIDSTERLGIFLYAMTSDLSMRKLAERFQRSTQTIHHAYHHVLKCLISKPIYTSKIKSATLHLYTRKSNIAGNTALISTIALEPWTVPTFLFLLRTIKENPGEIEMATSHRTFWLSAILIWSLQTCCVDGQGAPLIQHYGLRE